MDITLLADNAIRLKGKNSSLIVDPTKSLSKIQAEGVIRLKNFPEFSTDKVEDSRITVAGPGEYEVGGIKTSAISVGDELVVRTEIDGVWVITGNGVSVEKVSDKLEGGGVALIRADEEFDYAALSKLEPRVLIVYGQLKDEMSKKMGKEGSTIVSKFSVTPDKLPEEMQFVLLG